MTTYHHSILLYLLLLLPYAAAQSDSNPASSHEYPYKKLSSSMTVILAIFFVIFFLIALMSIYIRQCADSSEEWSSNSTRRHRSSTSRFWKRNHAGLDTSLVQSFPTFSFSEIKDRKIGNPPLECAVCLNELDDGKILRLLPNCGHVFHRDCIDNWIVSHNTCPVCRTDLSKKRTAVIVETRSTDRVVGEIENQISITITNVVQDNTFLSSENLKPEKEKLRRSRSAGQLSCVFLSDDEGRSEKGDRSGGLAVLRRTCSAAENGRSAVCDCTMAVKMDGDGRPLTVPV